MLDPSDPPQHIIPTSLAVWKFLKDREAANLAPKTIQWYREKLDRYAAQYSDLPTTPDPIKDFLRVVPGGDHNKHAYFRSVRALYNFVHEEWGFPLDSDDKRWEANPIRRVKPPKVRRKLPRSLSLEQLHSLLSASNDSRECMWQLRDLTIITLIADTGVRLSEAAGLTWDDVLGGTIYVDGKTGQREVPISPQTLSLLKELKEWNEENFGPHPRVFLGKKGALTPRGMQKVINRAFKRADLDGPRSSPHTLRHTFGRNWISAGGDLFSLQRIFGHTTLDMVRVYVNLDLEDTIRQHRRFSPLKTQAALAQKVGRRIA